MLKKFLTEELEKARMKRAETLRQCGELRAMLREARGLRIPKEEKRELTRMLAGYLAGKQSVLKLVYTRLEQMERFLEYINRMEEQTNGRSKENTSHI